MAERLVQGNFMRSDKLTAAGPQPQTRNELQTWVSAIAGHGAEHAGAQHRRGVE